MRHFISFAKKHYLLTGFILVILLVNALVPMVVKTTLESWLSEQTQSPAKIANLDINLFTGKVKLQTLSIDSADYPTQIGEFDAKLKLASLLRGQIHFGSAHLKNAQIPFTLLSDAENQHQLKIAGILFPKFTENTTENKTPEPKSNGRISVGIDLLALQNVTLNLQQIKAESSQKNTFEIQRLSLQNLYSWETDFARLKLISNLDQHDIQANLQLHLFTDTPKIVGTFKLKELPLKALQAYAPETLKSMQGKLNAEVTFTLEQTINGLSLFQYSDVTLSDSELTMNNQMLSGKQLAWAGDIHLFLGETKGMKITGALKGDDLFVELPNAGQLQLKTDLQTKLDMTLQLDTEHLKLQPSGSLSLNNLTLKHNTTQASAQTIHYTGNLAWQNANQSLQAMGNVNVQNLKASQPNLTVQTPKVDAKLALTLIQTSQGIEFDQKGRISLSKLRLDMPELTQQINKIDWNGLLAFAQTSAQNKPSEFTLQADGDLAVQNSTSKLHSKESSLAVAANLATKVNLTGRSNSDEWTLNYQGDGKISNLEANNLAHIVKLAELNWNANSQVSIPNAADETLSAKNPLKLQLKSTLSAKQLAVASAQTPDKAAIQLQALSIGEVMLSLTHSSAQHLRFNQLELDHLHLGETDQTISQVAQLELNHGQILLPSERTQTPLKIELGSLQIKDTQTHLSFDQDKTLTEMDALQKSLNLPAGKKPQEHAKHPRKENAEEPPNPLFALASVTLKGKNLIDLRFQEGNKQIAKQFEIEQFQLGALNSAKPEKPTAYQLEAKLDEFSRLATSGEVTPFSEALNLTTKTQIQGLSLLDFSPFVENKVGYRIESGQLSSTIDGTIANNKIDLNNRIHLAQFKLGRSDQQKSASFDKNFQVPLEVGLQLLRDKKGNIDLKLPISGDLDNPNFNINDVINTALSGTLSKATKSYLLLALQPFGAIALAGEFAVNQLSAIRLQPIEFTQGNTQLSTTMQAYLQKVSAILKEKSGLKLKLCADANQLDQSALQTLADANYQTQLKAYQQTQKENKASNQAKVAEAPAPQKITIGEAQMLELAKNRQIEIKRYLLTQGTKTDQVIFCQPKISQDSNTPKVDLGI